MGAHEPRVLVDGRSRLHALGRFYERHGTAPDRLILAELFNNVARQWPRHLGDRPHAFAADNWLVELGR
jgi:hypothetical protein